MGPLATVALAAMLSLVKTLLTIFVFLLASCTDSSTSTYAEQLDPLLYENTVLNDQLLNVAGGIYNDTVDSQRTAELFRSDVIPIAQHLAHQAAAVQAPEEWAASHAELVEIWAQRAHSYRELSEALWLVDAERFSNAQVALDKAAREEETWFADIRQKLAKQGVALNQFP